MQTPAVERKHLMTGHDTDDDTTLPVVSATERRLQRLLVRAPASYDPRLRVDWSFDPDADRGQVDGY